MIHPGPSRRRLLAPIALLAAVGAFAEAPPAPPPGPDPKAVAERFRQLDDPDAAVRRVAVEALIVTKDAQDDPNVPRRHLATSVVNSICCAVVFVRLCAFVPWWQNTGRYAVE